MQLPGLQTLESRRLLSQDLMLDTAAAAVDGSGADGAVLAELDTMSISAIVRNRGNEDAWEADLKVVLTRDLEIPSSDDEDISIMQFRLPELAVQESAAVVRTFEIPELQSGMYYVFLKIRPDDGGWGWSGSSVDVNDPSQNNTMFTGLRINVIGSPAPDDPGLRTGGIKAKLRGPGSVSVTRREDGLFDIEAVGTTLTSSLTIERAPGFNHVGDVRVHGSLNIFDMHVALPGNLTIDGDVKDVKLRYVMSSIITLSGTGKEPSISTHAIDGGSIIAAVPIRSLKTGAWLAGPNGPGQFTAPGVKDMKVRGSLQAHVQLSGIAGRWTIESAVIDDYFMTEAFVVRGTVKLLRSDGMLAGTAISIMGELRDIDIRGDASGTVSALFMHKVSIKHDLTDATILAGVFLGADVRLGGDDDTFTAGWIDEFKCGDDVIRSTIGAGIDPVNGILGDDDDVFIAVPGSRIGKITVDEQLFDSRFIAPVLPAKAKVDGKSIVTAGDPRFVTSL